MMKKIPNGKEIIKQEIEKAMKALQQNTQCSVANDRMRMLEELSNKIVSQGLQDNAQRQIAIPLVENFVEKQMIYLKSS